MTREGNKLLVEVPEVVVRELVADGSYHFSDRDTGLKYIVSPNDEGTARKLQAAARTEYPIWLRYRVINGHAFVLAADIRP